MRTVCSCLAIALLVLGLPVAATARDEVSRDLLGFFVPKEAKKHGLRPEPLFGRAHLPL